MAGQEEPDRWDKYDPQPSGERKAEEQGEIDAEEAPVSDPDYTGPGIRRSPEDEDRLVELERAG